MFSYPVPKSGRGGQDSPARGQGKGQAEPQTGFLRTYSVRGEGSLGCPQCLHSSGERGRCGAWLRPQAQHPQTSKRGLFSLLSPHQFQPTAPKIRSGGHIWGDLRLPMPSDSSTCDHVYDFCPRHTWVGVCMCVCVSEREREIPAGTGTSPPVTHTHLHSWLWNSLTPIP